MLAIVGHGGGCCGVRHIKNFTVSPTRRQFNYTTGQYETIPEQPITKADIDRLIFGERNEQGLYDRHYPQITPTPGQMDNNGGRSRGKVIEAIITDSQFRAQPQLAQEMKEAGFKLVTRFSNNTGGMCNILHRVTGGRDIQQAARRNAHIRTLIS